MIYNDETNTIDLRCFCYKCEGRTKETYRLHVRCFNCGWKGEAILRKGDRPGPLEECPHCGIARLDYGDDPAFDEEHEQPVTE